MIALARSHGVWCYRSTEPPPKYIYIFIFSSELERRERECVCVYRIVCHHHDLETPQSVA